MLPQLLRDESTIGAWEYFFEKHYRSEIETIALTYPETRSLTVDYWEIDKANTELAELLLEQPYKAIFNAEEAIRHIDTTTGNNHLHFRVINLPETNNRRIGNLRSHHMGKLTSIDGLIKRSTKVKPKLQIATFHCLKCGAMIKVSQDEDILEEPGECYEDQGGCGRVSKFKLSTSLSTFVDAEKIILQENPEVVTGGQQPQSITVYLEDDLVAKANPGDRVTITGIPHSLQKIQGKSKLTRFDFVFEAISIEVKESAFESIEITESDEKEIIEASKSKSLFEDFINSIAPAIYGLSVEKEAVLLQLFGGVPKLTKDNTRIRGDIHTLFVGDPGTAKSQLMNYAYEVAPRSIKTSGEGNSKAGLTAAAVKDEFNDGQWVLDAGAMVFANEGLIIIDEFNRMDEEGKGSLHNGMEQQEVTVNKAGINATLKTRCSVLASANPTLGRFDDYVPIHQQIGVKPALLSRFDLIFSIQDRPQKERDMNIAKHIGLTHQNPNGEHIEPKFKIDFMRKYIAYAKQNVLPEISDDVIELFSKFYTDLRVQTKDSVPLTPRQLEALYRLAEASARVRLSDTVTLTDAERAVSIFTEYLRRVGMDPETGNFDIDLIATGISHSQHELMRSIQDIIKTICNDSEDNNASRSDIISEAEVKGLESKRVESALDRLKRNGEIFEPVRGKYRIT